MVVSVAIENAAQAHEVSRKLLMEKVLEDTYASDALYMVDLGEVVRQHQRWQALLPGVEAFYAVKCNSDPAILRTLAALGCGFDCASKAEIVTMMGMGVKADDIIYANPCKAIPYLRYASEVGVRMVTFDNEAELYKIAQFLPNAKLVLRILTDDSHSVCALGTKFGAKPDRVAPLLHTAHSLGLNVIGVSFHCGSGCYSSEAFRDAVFRARSAFNIGAEIGFKFDFLDLGGGFPGTDDAAISFPEIAGVLREALAIHFPPGCGVRMIAEPGRYFASACHKMATNIIAKRTVAPSKTTVGFMDNTDSGVETASSDVESIDSEGEEETISPASEDDISLAKPRFMYYVSDGVYGAFNCVLYDHALPHAQTFYRHPRGQNMVKAPMYTRDNQTEEEFEASIWGPTCDSMDCITKDARLPELDVGDWLLFEDMGAYTKAAATTFNGMQLARSYYINTEYANCAVVSKALNGLALTPTLLSDF
eukprot:comp24696_c0_seq1/m.46840 comp24696_c0_seq1/g.46840  ORF comp24696_c0_seq1/g.46840 comp24696_c0_seq1/m.46840 type:complete len:479 (-) comp24696_c0_seq1:414-1850(-)